MAKSRKRTIGVYRTYNFVDKDPIIDRLRTAVQDSKMSYRDIHDECGVSVTTLSNWFSGKTRRPFFCTAMATLRACGIDLQEKPYSIRNKR